MRGFLIFALMMIHLGSVCQTLVDSNSWFLAIQPNAKLIVYFKANSRVHQEYMEGQIYLHDIKSGSNTLLNNNQYVYDFLNIQWTNDGKYFFLSDGNELTVFAFESNTKRLIYKCDKGALINNISVSSNGRFVVINIKRNEEAKQKQNVYLIDRSTNNCEELYSINDTSIGETIKNKCLVSDAGDVYILDINKKLLKIRNGGNRAVIIVESFVKDIYCLDKDFIYFSNNESLIRIDVKTAEKFKIINSTAPRIDYVGHYKEDIVINLNDNIFVYNAKGRMNALKKLPKGVYSYIDDGLALRQMDSSLYYYKNFDLP